MAIYYWMYKAWILHPVLTKFGLINKMFGRLIAGGCFGNDEFELVVLFLMLVLT